MKKIFEITEKATCIWLTIYFFLLGVFITFRLNYTFVLRDYLSENTSLLDILEAEYRGALLSMTSSGYIGIFLLLPLLFFIVFEKNFLLKIAKIFTATILFILSLLHIASFPFYRTFRENFNQMVFRGINEDWTALIATFYEEFSLSLRLTAAILLCFLLYKIFFFLIKKNYIKKLFSFFPQIISLSVLTVFCYITVLWTLFGGALSWEHQVDFENSGVMGDNFLNEAILDSPQAIFRGYTNTQRVLACNGLDFTAADVKRLAAFYSGKAEESSDLDYYLTKQATGAKIPKPKHIFVILAESYAVWPLLDDYENLHIADGMREIINEENSDCSLTMLPDGSSTVSAVVGTVTGLADANLYLTAMNEAYKEPYSTAIAPIFKRLRYKTNFYYAGPATWENIGAFTKAQGFENFISKGDFISQEGSVWGVKDAILFEKVLACLSDEASFNVILTASNHSPFDLDMKSEGIPVEAIRKALPEKAQDDEWLIKELGHFYYGDREIARFIKAAEKKYPNSLFIVMGDHADRYNMEKIPSNYRRYAVPFIIHGEGIKKGLLHEKSAGSHIDIAPTIVELIAKRNFEYCSLGKSLSENLCAVNYGFFMTRDIMGQTDKIPLDYEKISNDEVDFNQEETQNHINAIRAISWWRGKYGNMINEELIMGD